MRSLTLCCVLAGGWLLAASAWATPTDPAAAPTAVPAGATAASTKAPVASAPAAKTKAKSKSATPPPPVPTEAPPFTSPYHSQKMTEKAKDYYASIWGIDHLRVSLTSSDNLVRFSYRVVEPKLSKPLGDHSATAELVDLRTNTVLSVPTMEKIGPLRQLGADQAGLEYWIAFSNKDHPVHSGDRVNVIIGKFRALGLIVE